MKPADRAPKHLLRHLRRHPQMPLLLCGLVMAIAMLSFYVVLINKQIQRGELLRQSFVAASAAAGTAGAIGAIGAIGEAVAGHPQALQPPAPGRAGNAAGR